MATRAAERRFGIETKVLGTTFRSRLEARWALMFTALGWEWEYEPFDADGYIPDFVIVGPHPLVVEIKPCVDTLAMAPAAKRAASALLSAEIVGFDALAVMGSTPLPAATLNPTLGWYDGVVPAGVIVGESWYGLAEPDNIAELAWAWVGNSLNVYANGENAWERYPSGQPYKPDYCQNRDKNGIAGLWREFRDVTRWKAGA